ncbi:hypothetical protein [Marinimicrobium agarilyticum]|uniref:hypothetical protein n=1 Tax=Marinimicrobium agarilyticum TaxID=306546 RepID=UPI0012F6FD83|nr:hypothetical protein [Marinimicrobium agarilyticum]
MRVLFLAFFLMLAGKGIASELSCEDVSTLSAVHAENPVVKVAPDYPNKGTQPPVSGCAVLTFSLDRSEPASTPKNIKIEHETGKVFGKSAKNALEKWLYINRNVPESDRYYIVFHFDLSDS